MKQFLLATGLFLFATATAMADETPSVPQPRRNCDSITDQARKDRCTERMQRRQARLEWRAAHPGEHSFLNNFGSTVMPVGHPSVAQGEGSGASQECSAGLVNKAQRCVNPNVTVKPVKSDRAPASAR